MREARDEERRKIPLSPSRKIKAAFASLASKSASYAGYGGNHLRLSHISLDGLPLELQERIWLHFQINKKDLKYFLVCALI